MYASIYWVRHVQGSLGMQMLKEPVEYFIQEHLIHWLEALSIYRRLEDGYETLLLLLSLYVSRYPDTLA